MRRLVLALSLAAAAGPAAADPTERLLRETAGVYFAQDPRVGENTMEIVPYGPRKAYIRLRTAWSHGHACSAYGIFRVEADAYVHDGTMLDGGPCRMTIRRTRDRFAFSVRDLRRDESIQACLGGCGARGSFDREDRFRIGQRRPIRYLQRLVASPEYEAAVAYDAGRLTLSETVGNDRLPEVEAANAYERERSTETPE